MIGTEIMAAVARDDIHRSVVRNTPGTFLIRSGTRRLAISRIKNMAISLKRA